MDRVVRQRLLWLALLPLLTDPAFGDPAPASTDYHPDPPMVVILRPADRAADAYLDSAKAYYRAAGAQPLEADSLTELHNLLHQRANAVGAIGELVLVAHGSTWTGADIDLFPDGPKASVSSMRQARQSGAFPALPADSFSDHAQVRLESCAVGRHSHWLSAFADLWVADGEPAPEVLASKDFVAFGHVVGDRGSVEFQRFVLPTNVRVISAAEGPEVPSVTREEGADCAPLPSPCERRLLPIRVEVTLDPLVTSTSFAAPRRMAIKLARAELVDLNLRPEQLHWIRLDSAERGAQRWQGVATAVVTTAHREAEVALDFQVRRD